jgi:hypothetical protein
MRSGNFSPNSALMFFINVILFTKLVIIILYWTSSRHPLDTTNAFSWFEAVNQPKFCRNSNKIKHVKSQVTEPTVFLCGFFWYRLYYGQPWTSYTFVVGTISWSEMGGECSMKYWYGSSIPYQPILFVQLPFKFSTSTSPLSNHLLREYMFERNRRNSS